MKLRFFTMIFLVVKGLNQVNYNYAANIQPYTTPSGGTNSQEKTGVKLYSETFNGLEFDSFHIAMLQEEETDKKLLELSKEFSPRSTSLKEFVDKISLGTNFNSLALVDLSSKKFICSFKKCTVIIFDVNSSYETAFSSIEKRHNIITLKLRFSFSELSCDATTEVYYNNMLQMSKSE